MENKHSTFAKSSLIDLLSKLNTLEECFDDSFDCFLDKLIENINNQSIIFTSGIGKAGIIAKKLSASLSSIGISSFFIHPIESMHGDIGSLNKKDSIILFSNSGNTKELVDFVPVLKNRTNNIFSITSKNSIISDHSVATIKYGNIKELSPIDIAPTVSTSFMIILSDIITMSLANYFNIDNKKFIENHPLGNLGKLYSPLKNIMRKGDKLCKTNPESLVKDVIETMTKTLPRTGSVIITNQHNKLLGFFTDGDLRRCLKGNTTDFLNEPISKHMTIKPFSLNENIISFEALNILKEKSYDYAPIVNDDEQITGLIDIQDLI